MGSKYYFESVCLSNADHGFECISLINRLLVWLVIIVTVVYSMRVCNQDLWKPIT